MPKGFDSVKNGLIFGGLFGALLYFASSNMADKAWIAWIATNIDKLSNWMMGASWWPASITSVAFVSYAIVIIAGMALGAYIDSR